MSLSIHEIRNFFVCITLIATFCCSGFLFSSNTEFLKYFLLSTSLVATILTYRSWALTPSSNIFTFFKPWIPLSISIFFLMIVHGVHGYSIYITAFFLYCLLVLSLSQKTLSRQTIIFIFSINLFALSLAVLFYFYYWGINGAGLYGINKNKLLPGMTFFGICCIFELVINAKNYTKGKLLFIFFSVLASILATVVSEVRTVLLAYLAILPLLVFYCPKHRLKVFVIACTVIVMILIGFALTGRLQEGFNDLEKFMSGNSNSSWGIRLELWQLALQAFIEKPLFGWGAKSFDLITSSGLTFSVPTFRAQHFHSDYFNLLACGGLVGVLGWLTTLVLLFKKASSDPIRLGLIVSSLAMALSERIWFSNQSTLLVLICLWILLGLSSPSRDQSYTNE